MKCDDAEEAEEKISTAAKSGTRSQQRRSKSLMEKKISEKSGMEGPEQKGVKNVIGTTIAHLKSMLLTTFASKMLRNEGFRRDVLQK